MPPPQSPHPVKSLRGPLIIIAAAIVWCGAGSFYSSSRAAGAEYAMIGLWVAGVLFFAGLMISFAGGDKED